MTDLPSPTPPKPPAYARHWIKMTTDSVDDWRVPDFPLTHREIGHVYGDAILSARVPDSDDYRAARYAPAVVALRGEMLARADEWLTEARVLRVYHLYGGGTAKGRDYEAMIERWVSDCHVEGEWETWAACEDGPVEVEYVGPGGLSFAGGDVTATVKRPSRVMPLVSVYSTARPAASRGRRAA